MQALARKKKRANKNKRYRIAYILILLLATLLLKSGVSLIFQSVEIHDLEEQKIQLVNSIDVKQESLANIKDPSYIVRQAYSALSFVPTVQTMDILQKYQGSTIDEIIEKLNQEAIASAAGIVVKPANGVITAPELPTAPESTLNQTTIQQ